MSNELATIQPAQLTQVSGPPRFSFEEMKQIANAFAQSGLFGVKTPAQALAICLIADAEGIHPAQAALDYYVINGRPALYADAMLRRFLRDGGAVEWVEYTDERVVAKFSHPRGGECTIDWDNARVRQAGLTGNHGKYPRAMKRSRVISEAIKTVWPGAANGMYTPEEVQEFEPANAEPVGYAEAPMKFVAPEPNRHGFTDKQRAQIEADKAEIARRAEFASSGPNVPPAGPVDCDLPPIDADFDDLPAGTQHVSQVLAALPEGIDSAQVVGGNQFVIGKPDSSKGGVKFVVESARGQEELFYYNLANAQQRSGLDAPWQHRGTITFRRVKEKSAGKWDVDQLHFPELEAASND